MNDFSYFRHTASRYMRAIIVIAGIIGLLITISIISKTYMQEIKEIMTTNFMNYLWEVISQ